MAEVDVMVVAIEIKNERDEKRIAERLRTLRNDGWEWALAGGGTGLLYREIAGFVILERPKQ